NGIYIYDVGSSLYEGNNNGGFDVIYHRHARIRLLNKNSFDLATVKIHLYDDGDFKEKISDFSAATYNIENGKVVITKVDKGSLFKDKGDNEVVNKFTFPNIKEGSIIEFDYKVSSPSYRFIEPWYFQGDYPKLWSEYSVAIPEFFDFVTITQGYNPFVLDSGKINIDNYHFLIPGNSATERSEPYTRSANTIFHIWAMQNVPSIKEEEFTTTLRNHISKIEFQLSLIKWPDQPAKAVMPNWYEAAADLMKNEYFGEDLGHDNGWLNDDIKKTTAGIKSNDEKAKKIYEYVRDNFSCTDNYAMYLSQPLKKTMQLKKGNVADINILLAAMLQNAGFEVHPVLLSTRWHGKTYPMYPIMNQFNYVLAQAKGDDKSYLLDASTPGLGFNQLTQECYNGYARVVADNPVLITLSADSLMEKKLTTVFIVNDADTVTGSFSTQLGNQESEGIRKKLQTTKQEDFFKDIKKAYPAEIELSNTEIDSLKIPEEPVSIKYDIKLNFNDEDIVYFNPMLAEITKDNPFKAADRLYPVEMPSCFDEMYILNMEVPKGYKVEELPKSARVKLNENEGMFEYIIAQSGSQIQFRCHTVVNKATFEPEDYQTLRDFFTYVVKKQAEQIVFKKQ
ncbi:MAG TPA: transglutaminase domain-containing protein, partial [Panacibacter sp.]|nr:transglutaminase domain-containing protein [Panacibacter sp.]